MATPILKRGVWSHVRGHRRETDTNCSNASRDTRDELVQTLKI